MANTLDSLKSYAEFLQQQREDFKQIVIDHTNSNQFRDQHKQLIKDYHATDEYREKLFKQMDEYKTNKAGSFVKTKLSLIGTIVLTAILTTFCNNYISKFDYNGLAGILLGIDPLKTPSKAIAGFSPDSADGA